MGNHKALIVEDERDMAIEIADLLQSMGYEHATVDNLVDARRLLEEGEFCFVLLDLQIKTEKCSIRPRVEAGMTFLRELRQKHPRRGNNDMHLLPVIVVSGHAKEHEDIVRAFQAGANDFVRKPLGQFGQDLSAKITACLDRAGRHDHAVCDVAEDDAQANASSANITHSSDYREVWFRGEQFLFGELQARVIRLLSDEEMAWKVEGTHTYQDLALRCLSTMVECEPLCEAEPDRPRIHMPDVIPLVELKKR